MRVSVDCKIEAFSHTSTNTNTSHSFGSHLGTLNLGQLGYLVLLLEVYPFMVYMKVSAWTMMIISLVWISMS